MSRDRFAFEKLQSTLYKYKVAFVNQTYPKALAVDYTITSIPEKDLNHNKQIDAGDGVRFSYTINNTTSTVYKLAKLDTHVPRKNINYIHNLIGATGFIDDGKTIIIQNIHIAPNASVVITFDAMLNSSDQKLELSTQPQLFSFEGKELFAGKKVEVNSN